ncbi:MAG: Gfo/Idh/MocA family oxidoreductase [Erythrobacter sp.]|uniref:Gfo/Idh/MocA family protein n=1 Tax=Erythrobacter sp. TaxID=1042 RepID=UPI002612EFC0|nr:Gfo/Idh/MocA family oxidoreductase [Erythrobacter sp.]MDJ0978399.1 Gfo/Idh/MocA family oxidoreductase [Erythrobacter sp.]
MAYSVLIIGCGAIAGGYDAQRSPEGWPLTHAGAIARDERFALAACVDPDENARNAFAERWKVPLAAPDLESLNAQAGDYDLIVIASPTPFHAEHLEWTHGLGPKAVFCEKPLAHSFGWAQSLFYGYDQSAIPLAINYTRRWQPDLNALVEEVRQGDRWGRLLSAVGTYSKGVVHNGTHLVDLLMMFAGPVDLATLGPALVDHWDDDPTVNAILTAKKTGAPLHLVGGDSRAVTQFELVLNFERGEIAVRDGGMRIETRRVEDSPTFSGYRQLGAPTSAPGRYAEAMSAAYDDLAKVMAGEVDPQWSGANGLEAQAICEAMRSKALENLKKDPLG